MNIDLPEENILVKNSPAITHRINLELFIGFLFLENNYN